MPITTFRDLVNQALNIGGFRSGGTLELKTEDTKDDILRMQYEALKKKGIFGHGN